MGQAQDARGPVQENDYAIATESWEEEDGTEGYLAVRRGVRLRILYVGQEGEEEGWVYAGYGETPSHWKVDTERKPINWYAGKQYDDCFGEAKRVLANFDREFPQWAGRGYEVAGFVWWQGHKDGSAACDGA